MRILCGVTMPDAGSVEIDGQAVAIGRYGAAEAQARGIRVVHQRIVPVLQSDGRRDFFLEAPDAARPLPFGAKPIAIAPGRRSMRCFPIMDRCRQRGRPAAARQRQMVEIARAPPRPAYVCSFSTSRLPRSGPALSLQLRGFVRARAEQGLGFVFISHKLHEIVEVATQVVVLAQRRVAWRGAAADVSIKALVQTMGGEAETALRGRDHRGRPTARSR